MGKLDKKVLFYRTVEITICYDRVYEVYENAYRIPGNIGCPLRKILKNRSLEMITGNRQYIETDFINRYSMIGEWPLKLLAVS